MRKILRREQALTTRFQLYRWSLGDGIN